MQTSNDLVLHARQPFIVGIFSRDPDLRTLYVLNLFQPLLNECREMKHIPTLTSNSLHDLISFFHLLFHIHTTNFHPTPTKTFRRPSHYCQLFMLLPPIPQIPRSLLQLSMRRNDLDRNEP